MKNTLLFSFFVILLLNACSPRYIVEVDSETRTKFGIEVTAPNMGIFFVENKNTSIGLSNTDHHNKIAKKLYNEYGPARDNFYIAQTNAKDFKFNTERKTYYVEVQNLPRRTAMIIFDGKNKPIVCFEPEKYADIVRGIITES